MKWFKMHSEARNDAKLRTLPDDQFRTWFNLLCLASEQPERGIIAGFSDELLAIEVCNADTALLRVTLEKLVTLRVTSIDEVGTITFINFTERQYDKPSAKPESVAKRVQNHRERQKKSNVTRCNAPVTPSNAVKRIDTDTERDKETEEEVCEYENVPPRAQATAAKTNGNTRTLGSSPNRDPFDLSGADDPRYHTPHFEAMCRTCQRDPKMLKANPHERALMAGIAAEFAGDGYAVEDFDLMAAEWPQRTPPTPRQVASQLPMYRNLRINPKPTGETNGTHNRQHQPYQTAGERKNAAWERFGNEILSDAELINGAVAGHN